MRGQGGEGAGAAANNTGCRNTLGGQAPPHNAPRPGPLPLQPPEKACPRLCLLLPESGDLHAHAQREHGLRSKSETPGRGRSRGPRVRGGGCVGPESHVRLCVRQGVATDSPFTASVAYARPDNTHSKREGGDKDSFNALTAIRNGGTSI